MFHNPLPPSTTRNHLLYPQARMVLYYTFCIFAWSFCIKLVPHQLTVILGLVSTKAIFSEINTQKTGRDTNLLTEGPAQIAVFCLFQCFVEKEYQTGSKRNETFVSRPDFRDVNFPEKRPLCSPAPGLLLADEAPT